MTEAIFQELSRDLSPKVRMAWLVAFAPRPSDEELVIFTHLSEGLTLTQVAQIMGCSAPALSTRASELVRSLGLVDRTQALAVLIRRGWIHLPNPTPAFAIAKLAQAGLLLSEQRLVTLLSWGYSTEEVVCELGLSRSSVLSYIGFISSKLGTSGRNQMIALELCAQTADQPWPHEPLARATVEEALADMSPDEWQIADAAYSGRTMAYAARQIGCKSRRVEYLTATFLRGLGVAHMSQATAAMAQYGWRPAPDTNQVAIDNYEPFEVNQFQMDVYGLLLLGRRPQEIATFLDEHAPRVIFQLHQLYRRLGVGTTTQAVAVLYGALIDQKQSPFRLKAKEPPLRVPLSDRMSRLIAAAMPLTQRQHEILTLAIEGLTQAEIGQRLKVTKHTVRLHGRSLSGRLGGDGRNDWAVIGISRGWLPLPSHLVAQVRAYRDLPPTDPGKDIVELLAMGYRLSEISQMRGVEIELIWSRMRALYRRLGISRAETAVAIAVWARQGKTPLTPVADLGSPKSEMLVRGNPTARQLAVLAQTALGYRHNQICQQLGLAYGTVVHYCVSARYRLNAHGRLDGIIKAIQAGLLPCPVTELGAVARFVQLRLTPVETELVNWALGDEPTAPSVRLLNCSHRLAGKIQPEHRPYAIDYIVAIALWAERGLGWSDEDREMALEWLSDRAEPGLDLPAIRTRPSHDQTKAAVLSALAEGYDVSRLAKRYGWGLERTKDYLKAEIGRGGQVSLAQAVSVSIRDREISPSAQLESRLQTIRNQVTLNGSEKKIITLLASARDPIAACERTGIAPRFLSLHMSRLQEKLGVHTPAGLVGVALWAGLLDDKPANPNSVGMI